MNNSVVWGKTKGLFINLSGATVFFLSINNHALISFYCDVAFDIIQFNSIQLYLQSGCYKTHCLLCGDGKFT